MILLAKSLSNDEKVHLGVMDIVVKRNAYGRQLGSFTCKAPVIGVGKDVEMVFIRAPYIETCGEGIEVLAEVDKNIVAARQENILVTSFHPELTSDYRMHRFFIDNIVKKKLAFGLAFSLLFLDLESLQGLEVLLRILSHNADVVQYFYLYFPFLR